MKYTAEDVKKLREQLKVKGARYTAEDIQRMKEELYKEPEDRYVFTPPPAVDTDSGLPMETVKKLKTTKVSFMDEMEKMQRELGVQSQTVTPEKTSAEAKKLRTGKEKQNESKKIYPLEDLKSIGSKIVQGVVDIPRGLTKANELIQDFLIKQRKVSPFALLTGKKEGVLSKVAPKEEEYEKDLAMYDEAKKKIGSGVDQSKVSKGSEFIGDIMGSMPKMSLNFIPGVGQFLFAASTAGDYAEQAAQQGATKEQQLLYGALGGAAEVTLNRVLGIIPRMKSILSGEAAKAGTLGKQIIKNALSEAVEEGAIDPVMGFAEKFIYNPDKKWIGPDGIVDFAQMSYDAAAGAAMSLLFSALGMPANYYSKKVADAYVKRGRELSESELNLLKELYRNDIETYSQQAEQQTKQPAALQLPAAKPTLALPESTTIEQGPIPVTAEEQAALKRPVTTLKATQRRQDIQDRLRQIQEIKGAQIPSLPEETVIPPKVSEQYRRETPKMVTPAEAKKLKTAEEIRKTAEAAQNVAEQQTKFAPTTIKSSNGDTVEITDIEEGVKIEIKMGDDIIVDKIESSPTGIYKRSIKNIGGKSTSTQYILNAEGEWVRAENINRASLSGVADANKAFVPKDSNQGKRIVDALKKAETEYAKGNEETFNKIKDLIQDGIIDGNIDKNLNIIESMPETSAQPAAMQRQTKTPKTAPKVAKLRSGKYKVSKFKKSLEKAPVTEKIRNMLNDEEFLYETRSNKKDAETAYARVERDVDGEMNRLLKDVGKSTENAVDSIEIYAVADKLIRDGRIDDAKAFVVQARPRVTSTAQALQALAVRDKLSPGGVLITAVKMLEESAPKETVKKARTEAKEVSGQVKDINEKAVADILNKLNVGGKEIYADRQELLNMHKTRLQEFSEANGYTSDKEGTRAFEVVERLRKQDEAAKEIADALGADVIFISPTSEKNNRFDGATYNGTIFINARAANPAHVVLGHEIMERLAAESPEAFNEFVEVFRNELDTTKSAQYRKELAEATKKQLGRELTDADFYREAAGDYSGEMFNNPDMAAKIVKQAPNVAEKIVRIIRDMIAKLKAVVNRSYQVERYIRDAEKVRDAYFKAMGKFTPKLKAPKGTAYSVSRGENAAFDKWFGDSKVVDEKGQPLVVYHGTPTAGFAAFDKSKLGKRGTFESARLGFYFSDSPAYAGAMSADIGSTNRAIYPVYLSIKNPLYVFSTELTGSNVVDNLILKAKSGKHDGIIDEMGNYVVFEPTQIKSATGNVGTYSLESPDIRYSVRRGEAPKFQTRLDKIIRKAATESGINLRKLITQHYTVAEEAGKSLAQKLTENAGLTKEEAEYLSKQIQDRMREMTEAKKRQYLDSLFKKRTAPSSRKALSDRVIELSNMGALGETQYAEILNEKYGIPQLSAEEARSIVEQAEQIQKINNVFKRQAAINKMMAEIRSKVPAGAAGKVRAYTLINTLLNPKTIGSRNVLGNISQAIAQRVDKYVMSAIDWTKSTLTGKERKVTWRTNRGVIGMWKQFIGDIRTGGTSGWEGYSPYGTVSEFKTATQQFRGKYNPFTYLEKALGASLGGAGDYPFYMKAVLDSIGEQSVLRAMNEGYRGKDLKAKAKEYADEIVNSALNMSDYTREALDKANRAGEKATFRDPNVVSTILREVHDAFNIIGFGEAKRTYAGKVKSKQYGIGDLVVFFSQTPGSLLNIGFEYSPAGILKSVYYIGKGIHDSRKGTGGYNTEKIISGITKAVGGTLFLSGLGYFLTLQGAMTGKGEDDEEARQFLDENGKRSYSVNLSAVFRWFMNGFAEEELKPQDGDKWFTYDWIAPFSFNVGLGANVGQRAKKESLKTGQTLKETFPGALWKSSLETLYDDNTVSNLLMPFRGYEPMSSLKQTFINSISRFVPFGSILNMVRQMTDNAVRSTKSDDVRIQAMNIIKNRVPGLSKTLPEIVTTTGNVKELYQGGTNNFLNVVLNPGFIKQYKETPGTKLLIDLYESTGKTTQFPRKARKSINVYGQTVELTDAQQADLQKYIGYSTMLTVNALTEQSAFNRLSDEKKVETIYTLLNEIGNNGEEYMAKALGIKKPPAKFKTFKETKPKFKTVKP